MVSPEGVEMNPTCRICGVPVPKAEMVHTECRKLELGLPNTQTAESLNRHLRNFASTAAKGWPIHTALFTAIWNCIVKDSHATE